MRTWLETVYRKLMYNAETRDMLIILEHLLEGDESWLEALAGVLGQDVNLHAKCRGWNALHVAAFHGLGWECKMIVESDNAVRLVSSINRKQMSFLMCASRGHTRAKDDFHEQAMEEAMAKAVELLSPSQLRHRDGNHMTALHSCAMHGVPKIVKMLLARGLDPKLLAWVSATAASQAQSGKRVRVQRTPLDCALAALELKSRLPPSARSVIRIQECIKLLRATADDAAREPGGA